jgi:rRNA maturation endonuclease Nob1
MSDGDSRKLAEDRPARMVNCQWCSEKFDWREDTCPNCGWNKDEWASEGRYGLGKSG